MPFYRGDYYRGDYYRGDFWSSLANVGKKIGGNIAQAAGAIADPVGAARRLVEKASGRGSPPPPPQGSVPGAGYAGPPQGGGGGTPNVPMAPTMRGYHWNKTNEYNPGVHRQIAVPKHSKLVKNRHMNVANPRALARAARRAHGFLRLSSRFVRYYQPHAKKGHPYIGRRKKR